MTPFDAWVIRINETFNGGVGVVPFPAVNGAVVYFNKCVNTFLQQLEIERVSQNIPACSNTQRIEAKNRFAIFIFRRFRYLASYRDKGLKFSVEPFCQPCVSLVRRYRLPFDVLVMLL